MTEVVLTGTQLIPVQQNGGQMSSQSTSQTVYRIPNTNQIVSIPSMSIFASNIKLK